MTANDPLATRARDLAKAGDEEGAAALIRTLVAEVTGQDVVELVLTLDQYSLNSVNGRAALADGSRYFYKFHSEEGEDGTIAEYYNAELLREHGYLVDLPVFANGEPGRQILLYALREEPRLADVARANDLGETGAERDAVILAAQADRDERAARILVDSLHPVTVEQSAAEPIHQLFHHRLTSPGAAPGRGGRVAAYYAGRDLALGEGEEAVELSWERLLGLRWRIDGVDYDRTLAELLDEAAEMLDPAALAPFGGVVAHGDDHNANIWFTTEGDTHPLVAFDPAFAGRHVPALLAEVKATFHNSLAHPLWLYEPALAEERFGASVRLEDGVLVVERDWSLTPLRAALLVSRAERTWRPLVAALEERSLLPAHWKRIVRLALMLCPLLVRDVRAGGAGGHTPLTSALAFAMIVQCGAEPVSGTDPVADFLARIES
ncbi:hypothetical protein GRS96_04550 [Rathayibacter sp. VKM Ac-2803]|uniref:hypothetical protein n=1 Tax=Rathayibacter sp. VKM Ac-2803 TaxID=2609256 RepID=UPI0013585E3F|nr:hypothetical protein [Rathayibacter sp. VKM Ac-2803]MWV48546.1 hypothetical protein [Rathayibacter sp. VKM Ac-2803]